MIPSPPRRLLRRLGYLADQQGIASRYLAEARHWEEHLRRSRDFVTRCLEKNDATVVTVLGSGWWLDLPPIEDLSRRCSAVHLVDIAHPPQIVHRASRFPNVRLVEADLTGLASRVYQIVREGKEVRERLLTLEPAPFRPPFETGFVVSLNLLSQLDDLLLGYVRRKTGLTAAELLPLRRRIQESHLRSLPARGTCIITDTVAEYREKDTVRHREATVVVPLPEGTLRGSWTWTFDTRRAYASWPVTLLHVEARCL